MGYRSTSITGGAGYSAQSFGDSLTPGSLVSVSLQTRDPGLNCVEAYGRLIVTETSPDPLLMVAHLASGYFGYANPLSWHGAIPVGSEHYVIAVINAPGVARYRLTWWTLDKYTAATGIPRDP